MRINNVEKRLKNVEKMFQIILENNWFKFQMTYLKVNNENRKCIITINISIKNNLDNKILNIFKKAN